MPTIKDKEGKLVYISKKDLKKLRKQNRLNWNPEANGKLVKMDDGTIYEIKPSGWRRRQDVETNLEMQKKGIVTNIQINEVKV